MWPVLIAKAKGESNVKRNPDGAIRIAPNRLAFDAMCEPDRVCAALDALADEGLIRYTAEGNKLLSITLNGFAKWQSPKGSNADRQSRKRDKKVSICGESNTGDTSRHTTTHDVPQEREEEGEREEGNTSSKASPSIDIPRMLFDHWLTATRRSPNQNRLTAGRRAHVNGRLRDGYTVEQLTAAIDGIAGSAWHTGANPGSKRYDTFDFIMRNGENVEKGMEANSGATAAADLSAWGATGGAA